VGTYPLPQLFISNAIIKVWVLSLLTKFHVALDALRSFCAHLVKSIGISRSAEYSCCS
jgi:hypothetical protein